MQAQEDPGEVVGPIEAAAARTQRIFETAVDPLDHAVALRVVCRGGDVTYASSVTELLPERAAELRASVQCQSGWHAEAGHPTGDEGCGAVGGGGFVEGDRLNPPRGPVNDGEQVPKTA